MEPLRSLSRAEYIPKVPKAMTTTKRDIMVQAREADPLAWLSSDKTATMAAKIARTAQKLKAVLGLIATIIHQRNGQLLTP